MDSFARRDRFVQQLFVPGRKRKRFFSLLCNGNQLTSDTLDFRDSSRPQEHWDEREILYEIEPGRLMLRLNMRIYRKFPIVECQPWLENPGAEPSGIVEEFRPLDLQEELPPQNLVMPDWQDGTHITVRYNLGSCADINDFIPQTRELWTRSGSNRFIMESCEGRPSSTFLPYFGVDTGEFEGMNIGVGWGGARKAGMKFLAWFEPERVHSRCRGSILTEHPEWLTTCGDSDVFLLNLGNPEALDYIFHTLRTLIEEQGIDIYREDFNFNTLPYWAAMDAPDRIGVAEMKHVAGHYELWERLHQAFPDMPFDNCASGGRRLDYLALTYSWPLCRSDYACLLHYLREYVQVQSLYLSDWVPLHAGFTWMPEHDPYDFLSCSGTGISNKIWQYDSRSVPADDAYDWEYHRTMLFHQKRLRDILIDGNLYPLTERPDNPAVWCACQVHLPESGSGFVLAFRRPQSPEAQMSFSLNEIQPTAEYELEYLDGTTRIVRGGELASGLQIVMEIPRSVTLIYYRRVK